MDKVTITIAPEDWGNLVTKYPSYAKRLKIGDFTTGTKNIDTDIKGVITKRKGSVLYNPTPLTDPLKDQYEAIFTDSTRHLLVVEGGRLSFSTGDNLFTLVTSGYSALGNFEFATTQNRIYFGNGIDSPQVYDRTTSYGGVSYTAPQTKVMGAQAPSSAPTFGADTAGGSVPAGAHTYKVTFLYYDSEESNGGPATGVHTVSNPNNTVNLTAVPIGGYGVTARHIYRDDNDGNYVRVGTINNNTATMFSDTAAAGTFPIPLDHFTPPNFSMITLWLDRLWVSRVTGDPYTLFFSDPGFPDIYPDTNFIICNQQDPIEATIVYFDRLIVFNKKSMGQIIGSTKDTFRYSDIQGSVGCVDNRSIQIRVVNGVPILVWLSDRGFYSYDGNSVNYLSDPIEDQVNFNIQQSSQKKNKNVQSTQSDFQGGTASEGIDLVSIPGSITTINPTQTFDDETDWSSGVNTNTSIFDGSNTIKVPTKFTPTLASGTLTNLTIDGTNLKIPVTTNFGGEGRYDNFQPSYPIRAYPTQFVGGPAAGCAEAWPFKPPRSGVITTVSVGWSFAGFISSGLNTCTYKIKIWADSAGSPGTEIFASSNQVAMSTNTFNVSIQNLQFPTSASVTGGIQYWFGIQIVSVTNHTGSTAFEFFEPFPFFNGVSGGKIKSASGSWLFPSGTPGSPSNNIVPAYAICTNPVISTGQWASPIHDTFSDSITATLSVEHSGSYPTVVQCSGSSVTTAATILEGSDSSTFDIGEDPIPVSETFNDINGIQNYTIFGKRYWRVRIVLTSFDDRGTPIVGTPVLRFSTTSIWVSPTINSTADVTDYIALNTNSIVPSGTTLTLEVATSDDDITYPDGFVPFGTEVTRQYIKIRATLTADTDDAVTPTLISINLTAAITSTLTSSIIDTGVAPPAGWDIFQSTFLLNGGTVQFEMRSASTSGGIPAATFFAVTSGAFPNSVTPLQFVQWRVTLMATANNTPKVDDVTVAWFVELINSIRVASLFYNGRYYMSAAEFNEDVNNILFVLDLDGKWRVYKELNIATFSYFLNLPYWGSALEGSVLRFLEGSTDNGIDIGLEIRTKAFDYSTGYKDNSDMIKIPLDLTLQGKNTGASYQVSYSIDEGQTFNLMALNSGSTTFSSSLTGTNFYAYFRVTQDISSGRTVIYKITSSDSNEAELHGIKTSALIRTQIPVITG